MKSTRFAQSASGISFGAHTSQTPSAQSYLALFRTIGGGTTQNTLITRDPGDAGNGPTWRLSDGGGGNRIHQFLGASTGTAFQPNVSGAAGSVTLGVWQHAAATWDGGLLSTGIHIYVGVGKPLSETTYQGPVNGTTAAAYGGANALMVGNYTADTRGLNGDMAYVAQWDHVLTLAELRQAQMFGPLSVRGGLILFWDGERDLGPYSLKPTLIRARTTGFTIPATYAPVPKRARIFASAPGMFLDEDAGWTMISQAA